MDQTLFKQQLDSKILAGYILDNENLSHLANCHDLFIISSLFQPSNTTTICSEAPGSQFAKIYHITTFVAFYPVALGFIAYLYLRITKELKSSELSDITNR